MIKEVEVLPFQAEFIESTKPFTAIVGGYGSSKSYSGILKTIIMKLKYPSAKVCYYLPNFSHVRMIAFDRFPAMCTQLGLMYQLNKSDKELKIDGYGSILFHNMSEPEKIVGFETYYSCLDEIDILPLAKAEEAFNKILARNRTPTLDGTPNQLDICSTPEGFRFLYKKFVTNKNENQKLIKAKTADNPFLPDGYIEALSENYDPQLLKQYLLGEFVNVNSSSIYHQFDRDVHVVSNRDINTKYPLIISFDFNINPYNAIFLIQVINDRVYIIDNAIKKNASLVDSLAHLKEKFKHLGNYLFGADVYGDATGKARSQGTAVTNYHLIREAGFSNIKIKTSNPRVYDRINVVNSMLKNGKGVTKLFVCERNEELISDFEQMSYNDKGEVDKSNQDLSHSSDSVGYYLEYEHRINRETEIKASYA